MIALGCGQIEIDPKPDTSSFSSTAVDLTLAVEAAEWTSTPGLPVRPGDPGQLHYCAIGIATAAFSLAPEYKLVTGKDPFTRSHIEQIADLVCEFLFIRSGS